MHVVQESATMPLKNKVRIGVLTAPLYQAGTIPLSNLTRVLREISTKVVLITGNAGYDFFKGDANLTVRGLRFTEGRSLVSRLMKHVVLEFRLSSMLMRESKSLDVWIFFIGGESLILPLITCKILRIPAIQAFAGSSVVSRHAKKDRFAGFASLVSSVVCGLSDRLVFYSRDLPAAWGLSRYSHKTSIAHEHYLDPSFLTPVVPIQGRPPVVGHIGRLSREKGTDLFLKSIPLIRSRKPDVRFRVVGDGELKGELEVQARKAGGGMIETSDWIPHDQLPGLLSGLKLVVLPSYTEGLPNLMIEAMARGTIVVATPVGAVPEFVKNGETGFLIEDNSPEGIAKTVLSALGHAGLDHISHEARKLVEGEFTLENALRGWGRVVYATLSAE